MIWINGVNFKNLSQAGLLYGPFASSLPNGALFDFSSSAIAYDFGTPTKGYEMPYNGAELVMIYSCVARRTFSRMLTNQQNSLFIYLY